MGSVRLSRPPTPTHALSQISTPRLSSSFFNIPFLLFTSTPSNNHKKTLSRCLPSCMSFPPIFRRSRCFSRSILLPAVSLGRLPGQLIPSGCDLERTVLTWLCSLTVPTLVLLVWPSWYVVSARCATGAQRELLTRHVTDHDAHLPLSCCYIHVVLHYTFIGSELDP